MLTKCANPACSAQFKYLHQGKLFHLTPIPELQARHDRSLEFLYERFWLCDSCCKKMTVVWGGTAAKVVPLPETAMKVKTMAPVKIAPKHLLMRRAAHGGFDTDQMWWRPWRKKTLLTCLWPTGSKADRRTVHDIGIPGLEKPLKLFQGRDF